MGVSRRRRGFVMTGQPYGVVDTSSPLSPPLESKTSLPDEVKSCIDSYVGGRHVWGPINARRARAVAEAAQNQCQRYQRIMQAAALAALVARYVHPAVVHAAEAGSMQCSTEIPTDDV